MSSECAERSLFSREVVIVRLKRDVKYPAPFGSDVEFLTVDNKGEHFTGNCGANLLPAAMRLKAVDSLLACPIHRGSVHSESVYDNFICDHAPVSSGVRGEYASVRRDVNRRSCKADVVESGKRKGEPRGNLLPTVRAIRGVK